MKTNSKLVMSNGFMLTYPFFPTDRRKLITRKLAKEQINCSQCNSYECFVDEADMDDGYENKDEREFVMEWSRVTNAVSISEEGVRTAKGDISRHAMPN